MNKYIIALVLIAIAIGGYLIYTGQLPIPGLTTEATYVGTSFSSDMQTASPSISSFNTTINVETYKTTVSKIAPPPTCTIRNSTRNAFMEKLGQYGVTVYFYSTMTISNNETGEVYFQRTFNFTSGEDRKIEVLILKPIPDNVTLRIDIHIEISITSATFTWSKTIDRTIYIKTGTAYTPTKPYTTITGVLVNTTPPVFPIGTISASEWEVLAVQLQSYQWVYPTMSFSTPSIIIYLKYHGQLVSDPTILGLTETDISLPVIVSGYLSKDSYGYIYIEVENIAKSEVIIH
jgi:hypothetical protein